MKSFVRLIGFVLVLSQLQAFAGEKVRLQLDPKADLAKLMAQPITSGKKGYIQLSKSWSGHTVEIDASAVGDDDFNELYELAGDYDAYKRLKMPYVDNAKLIERRPDGTLLAWSQMTLSASFLGMDFDQTSQHFLDVTRVQLPNGARANTWKLVRMPKDSKLREWDNPKFNHLDGSWYQEKLPNGMTYIRYFLSADIDSAIPAWVIKRVAGGQMSGGVQGVIRTLAQEASTSP